jgi:hypothetical protein
MRPHEKKSHKFLESNDFFRYPCACALEILASVLGLADSIGFVPAAGRRV